MYLKVFTIFIKNIFGCCYMLQQTFKPVFTNCFCFSYDVSADSRVSFNVITQCYIYPSTSTCTPQHGV